MENAVDALKLAVSVFIFILGLTVLFSMTAQAKETARILIAESDKTTYYNYYEIDTNAVDQNGNRIVYLDDIIPVLYRYAEENYGVTIIDSDGNIVARFDLDTEDACNRWKDIEYTDEQRDGLINYINGEILEKVEIIANKITAINIKEITKGITDGDSENIEELFERLYGQDSTTLLIGRKYYCAWHGYSSYTAQRVDSDLSRNKG